MRLPSPALPLRAAAVCLAAALGCDSPLGPDDVSGTYTLERIAGDPLPAVTFENESVVVRVLADTLRLDGGGGGTAVSVRAIVVKSSGVGHGPARVTSELRYRVVGGRVEVHYVCPPNALCAAGPHLIARRTADGLVVDQALEERAPQRYVRVSGR